MKIIRKNEAGFSLLEVIVSITLFALFMTVSFIMLERGFSFLKLEAIDPGLQQELELTGLRICQDIIRSGKIKLPDMDSSDKIELKILRGDKGEWVKYSKYRSTFDYELSLQVENEKEEKEETFDDDEIDYTRRDSILNQIGEVVFQITSDSDYKILNVKLTRIGKEGRIYTWQRNVVLAPGTTIL